MMKVEFMYIIAMVMVVGVWADINVHNPPGNNNRNREPAVNVANPNRLFDSQNNNKCGYAWRGDPRLNAKADPITYYAGSHLKMEYTIQHACGPNQNTHCDMVIQYMCDSDSPGLRDGYPTGNNLVKIEPNNPTRTFYERREFKANNQQGTNTIPTPNDNNKPEGFPTTEAGIRQFYLNPGNGIGAEYGMHESWYFYEKCSKTTRNRGLYIADQKVRNDARGTRQNPNGGRYGFECPEERDYFPYWRDSPWKDIVIMTSNPSKCPYYRLNSQNVKDRWECVCDEECRNKAPLKLIPIDQEKCEAAGGTWTMFPAHGIDPPECREHAFTRDNHLGNSVPQSAENKIGGDDQPDASFYNWVVPEDMVGKQCIIRWRYNISTSDFPNQGFALGRVDDFNNENNCGNKKDQCVHKGRPLYNRPYVEMTTKETLPKMSLAINTNQNGRTFEDRTYVFNVAEPPSEAAGKTIYNLNLRGKRGNIVQTYPAVEFDFVPSNLEVKQGDYVHIQIHGSDFNVPRNPNDAEGWRYSDRANIIELQETNSQYIKPLEESTLFPDYEEAKKWALVGQNPSECEDFEENKNDEQNNDKNCGKLNRAPERFPANPAEGLMKVEHDVGTYSYVTTRNNNYSNRSHKGKLIVTEGDDGLTTSEKVGVAMGVSAGVGVAGVGTAMYGAKYPASMAGKVVNGVKGMLGFSVPPPGSQAV